MVVTTWGPLEACALQSALRLTNEGFAEKLGIATRTVANWRSDPNIRLRLEMQQLLDTLHSSVDDDVRERFERNLHDGGGVAEAVTDSAPGFSVASHKFLMAHVEPSHAAQLVDDLGLVEDERDRAWFGSCSGLIPTPFGDAHLYVWPFGSIACHLVEQRAWSWISDLAQWRVATYPSNLDWFGRWLSGAIGSDVQAAYVISAYWVESCQWEGEALVTAAHLLSGPKSLLPRTPQGTDDELSVCRANERDLFDDEFRLSEVLEFGVAGTSVGVAGWSGVAYAPLATERALTQSEIVDCELAIQALWVYCDKLSRSHEQGPGVQVDERFSWSFLKRARSRLNMSRPQESGQHKSMRVALVESSGIDQMLDNAIELVKEA